MQQIIDIKNLAKYEKNNRIEAKRTRVVFPTAFGRHIRLSQIRKVG